MKIKNLIDCLMQTNQGRKIFNQIFPEEISTAIHLMVLNMLDDPTADKLEDWLCERSLNWRLFYHFYKKYDREQKFIKDTSHELKNSTLAIESPGPAMSTTTGTEQV